MSVATRSINSPALQASLEPHAVRIARAATITVLESLPSEVIDKTKICLLDLIGGADVDRERILAELLALNFHEQPHGMVSE